MKALTVQQPWAWAILHGGKTIENRTQNWNYRGPLAIHAGKRWSDRGGDSPLVRDAYERSPEALAAMRTGAMLGGKMPTSMTPAGVIIGTVDLVDVHPDAGCCRPWGESAYVEHGGRERRRITHLVLENPRPLAEPIPCKGALGLWTPPAEVPDDA
ncbi:MAG: ASCH domain-containing protein [Rhodococcus sp. (in: high G+C Gram-positive bacteria)]